MKRFILFVSVFSLLAVSCHKKKIQYTTASVSAEIREQYKEARNYRRHGKLHKSAVTVTKLGKKITSEYPKAMVYREHVIKIMNFMYRLARLSRDKALEIKTESVNPDDAKVYEKHADELEKLVVILRKQLPSYPLLHKKVKKVSVIPKEEEKPDVSSTNDASSTGSSDNSEKFDKKTENRE